MHSKRNRWPSRHVHPTVRSWGVAMRNSFSILTVCTGNVCRSPLAEQLLRNRLRDVSAIEVSSAGLQALVEQPMFDVTQEIARSYGVEELSPRVTRRVFTLREFARLAGVTTEDVLASEFNRAGASPADRLRAVVQAVTAGRSILPPVADPSEDDVIDPYQREMKIHEASAQQLVPAVDAVASLLKQSVGGAV